MASSGDRDEADHQPWDSGLNDLALRPCAVRTYDRNISSNNALQTAGSEVLPIVGTKLRRGRGRGVALYDVPLETDAVQYWGGR